MRLFVPLSKPETVALMDLARAQRRRPQEQAALLISQALAKYIQTQDPGNFVHTSATPSSDEKEVADET